MKINTYQRATVNGVIFNSRGMDSTEPDDLHLTQTRYGSNDFSYTPTKELNNLQKTWTNKKNLRSWMVINYIYGKAFDTDEVVEKVYGQANGFFRFILNTDDVVNGLPMSSVILRETKLIKKLNNVAATGMVAIDCQQEHESLIYNKNKFCVLMYFVPSNVACVGVDLYEKPFLIDQKKMSTITGKNNFIQCISNEQYNSIKYLILRTLHPWRVNEAVTYYEQQLKPLDEKVSNLISNEHAAEEVFKDDEAFDEYESA